MNDFLQRHSYLVVWVVALVSIGAVAVAIFNLNGYIPKVGTPIQPGNPSAATPSTPETMVSTTTIIFQIQKSASGNSFNVQWQYLPSGTTQLFIFRGKTGTDPSTWSLWKIITIPSDSLISGNAAISLGKDAEAGYAFYIEAVGGPGGTPNNASGTPEDILWTSPSGVPPSATSTIPIAPPDMNPSSTPSSTSNPSANPSQPSSTSSLNPTTTTAQSPSGTPYYTPEIQISGYGQGQTANFWVQHVDQKIQINWQNIPATATSIEVARSENQTGPWTTVITQENPSQGQSGQNQYSIQIVDNTVGTPYYYQMTVFNGTTTLATYGPLYLAGN
jgi:hypothetical protein